MTGSPSTSAPTRSYRGGPGWEVLRTLGVTPAGSPPPLERYRLLVGDDLHLMPSGPGSLLRTTPSERVDKVALGRLLARLPRLNASSLAGVSVDSWLADLDLRARAESVLRALIRIGTYAADQAELSAEAAVGQLQAAARAGVLYLDGGWAQLVELLACQVQTHSGVQVSAVHADDDRLVTVETDRGLMHARAVVVAPGTPAEARRLLPDAPDWGDLGPPLKAAALDVAVRGVPAPGYVLGVDRPLYGTTQSPPARQAPAGDAVVSVLRYGTTTAAADRPEMERWLSLIGVGAEQIVHQRFLASVQVSGAAPRAVTGGLAGRPAVAATGSRGLFLAGDWVGSRGLLADASLASGHEAGLSAARAALSATTMVA